MIEYICKKVEEIKKKHDETDPFRLAQAMDIEVDFMPLKGYMGFFFCRTRRMHIIIDNNLPEFLKRFSCTHEIGHSDLHIDTVKVGEIQCCDTLSM